MNSSELGIECIGAEASRRPSEAKASAAIEEFLRQSLGICPNFHMVPDGGQDSAENKCGWAFWILIEDTTSYVREDLGIEWYGTSWGEEAVLSP